jgi:predicted nucleic acid-binding protein
MIVFLDTNIVIYLIETTSTFHARAQTHITALRTANHSFAVSDLVCLECRVWPLRQNDQALLAAYDSFFASAGVQVFPLTTPVCQRATLLRATYNFKTPDALQLATAIVHGCDQFLTLDGRLSRCPDIPIELLL